MSNYRYWPDCCLSRRRPAGEDRFRRVGNANSAATPLLDESIVADSIIYPPRDQQQRLFAQAQDSLERSRAITRLWQKFKTAQ
jgi:spermidine/putrescine-binding protein